MFSAFMIALITALLLTPASSRLACSMGLVDKKQKRAGNGIPTLGGVAVFIGFTVSVLAGIFVFSLFPGVTIADTPLSWRALSVMVTGSGFLMVVTGFIDDRFELNPTTKLVLHSTVALAAGAFFVMNGAQVRLFLEAGNNWIAVPVTLLWLVGITNSTNLLDHADGVTAGVGAISALFFAALNFINGNPAVSYLSVALAGAAIGFLFYNFPPASTYMGDSGSNFIGFMLGIIAILGVYTPRGSIPHLAVASPVLILAVPLVDTVMVLFYRRSRGTPLFQGDNNHLAHRLMRMGHSKRTAAVMLYLFSAIMGTTALLLPTLRPYQAVLAFLNATGVITVFAIFIARGERRTQ